MRKKFEADGLILIFNNDWLKNPVHESQVLTAYSTDNMHMIMKTNAVLHILLIP